MATSERLEQELLNEIARIPAIDVHTHVPSRAPCAASLRELLNYHYYTELAHSTGMSVEALSPDLPDEQAIPAMLDALEAADNTVQCGWLTEIAQELYGFAERRLTRDNWSGLAETIRREAAAPDRPRQVMARAGVERAFLTNSPDKDFSTIDAALFVPSMRCDALAFKLHQPAVREELERAGGVGLTDARSLRTALRGAVERFADANARSLAISLPPHTRAVQVDAADFDRALGRALRGLEPAEGDAAALAAGVLWELTGACRDFGLCWQMMYGVVRGAYPSGVHDGRDLPVAGDTLAGLLPLINAFPEVTFCLSVLTEGQCQELVSYGWLVHNVVLSGHWWYTNLPAYIARDLAARLQGVPKTKLVGYYSDAFKLDFQVVKFNMYRRVLARVLARDFVEAGSGSEADALSLAQLLLRDNAIRIFRL